ncbi:MAG: hypothetical protein IJ048_00735 [Clostridia bacterium]|nr:hypothetical protein [Clostridia bacterium]
MDRLERRMKKLALAGLGAAVITKEETSEFMQELVKKGEEVMDKSGIRNELLRYRREGDASQGAWDAQEWRMQLYRLTPEQLEALRDTIDIVEQVKLQDEEEGSAYAGEAEQKN